MRLVRTFVPDGNTGAVEDALDERDVDYVLVDEDSGREAGKVVEFPLPTQAVEPVLDDLRETGFVEDRYTVVVSAQSALSENFELLENRYITGDEEDDSIATEEIRSTALDLTPNAVTYYSMTLLSALVATAGLLLDSPAVVVGSMVIAPLVGSAMTASVGTVLGDRDLIVDGFRTQVFGLLLAVLGATAFSVVVRSMAFLPPALDVTTTQQIAQRISPGVLAVVIGASAGAAGAFGLATGVSVTLVGVMIAAALIPAAAAVGIGIAWNIPAVALGAALLLVLNAASIHVAGVSVLWYFGYRPWPREEGADRSIRHVVPLVAVVVVLGAVFVGAGGVVASHVAFEQETNHVVGDVLDDDPYRELAVVGVRTEFDAPTPFSPDRREQVTVVVSRPADRPYPALSRTIGRAIERETGRAVTVVVEFDDTQRYDPPAG